ncbi:hypothetical protein [Priestia megaterium]|uniref:hypothetical protein n=1 Tax=Priestia megaterium TaxID=1404 RepID=UPI0023DA115D|nr:hypothetical protein [Priestia megaterium]MDF2056290.1 hypothetical protein [Priestia megaterium]MDF2060252.1 hypothetical protein [Priestia megaterium]
MKKIAFFVGNGFTLDLIQQIGLNSSCPLQKFHSTDITYDDFIDKLPTVNSELFNQKNSDVDDFTAISNYVSRYKYSVQKDCELRRFLAISYSKLQLLIESYNLIYDWKWFKWIKKYKRHISCAISLNYDVILERTLRYADISYTRIGTDEHFGKIPILKPHGSIDFDVPKISIEPIESIWNGSTKLNNVSNAKIVPKSDWLLPRIEADIIPPSMKNIQLHLQWTQEMSRQYAMLAKQIDSFIMVGCSYWDVDRPEIDNFLKKLSKKKAKVYIMNPEPNPDLIRTLQALGLSYETFGFDELPW